MDSQPVETGTPSQWKQDARAHTFGSDGSCWSRESSYWRCESPCQTANKLFHHDLNSWMPTPVLSAKVCIDA